MRPRRSMGSKPKEKKEEKKEKDRLLGSLALAYLILMSHLLLIGGLGLVVLFFRGVVHYMPWIFLGGTALVLVSGYRALRGVRRHGGSMKGVLDESPGQGYSMEVRLLGGLAALRIGRERVSPVTALPPRSFLPELESPETQRIRQLSELARLFEKELITWEEYSKAKHGLLNP